MAGPAPDEKPTSSEEIPGDDAPERADSGVIEGTAPGDDAGGAGEAAPEAAGDVDPPSRKPATDDVDGSWGDQPLDPAVAPTLPAEGEATSVDFASSAKPPSPPRPAGLGARPPRPSGAGGIGKTAELGARPGGARSRPLHLEDSDDPDEDPQTATQTRDDVLGTLTARTNVVRPSADETTTRAVPSESRSAVGPLAALAADEEADVATAEKKGERPPAVTAMSARPPAVTAKRPTHISAGIVPRPMPPGTTADNLSAEDEDGPTMVVRSYPQAAPDDEATQVHPQRSLSSSQLDLPPLPPLQTTAQIDPDPLPVPPSGRVPFMEGLAIAQRQAAVDAALAAAMGSSEATEALLEQRERTVELTTTSLLGLGLTLTALASYLSTNALADGAASRAASYGGLTVFGALALFAAGLSTLQRRPNAKLGCLVGAGLLLIFTLTRLIVIAAS